MFRSNRLFISNCNLYAADTCVGLFENIDGSYGGLSGLDDDEEDDDENDDDENDDDDDDDDDDEEMNE